ncbi:hypothetical protein I79_024033 [Cricetulus griseus]|uniref:Uncharacterized protein n=1 Tax=Cricetulus griseus TaxID=10029 RepID=G3IJJ8_CRIGR|nr:hypothetical protein I79_024033 [Cricetulus griseus]
MAGIPALSLISGSFSPPLGLGCVDVSENCVPVQSPNGTGLPKPPADSREGWQGAFFR